MYKILQSLMKSITSASLIDITFFLIFFAEKSRSTIVSSVCGIFHQKKKKKRNVTDIVLTLAENVIKRQMVPKITINVGIVSSQGWEVPSTKL